MRAKVKIEHYSKNLQLKGKFSYPSRSFIQGFAELGYSMFQVLTGTLAYYLDCPAQGVPRVVMESNTNTFGTCFRGLPSAQRDMDPDDDSTEIDEQQVMAGIVIGGSNLAARADQRGLVYPLLQASNYGFNSTLPVPADMGTAFSKDICYDYQTGYIDYVSMIAAAPHIKSINPVSGTQVGDVTCDFVLAANSIAYGIASITDYWWIGTKEPAGSIIFRKVEKATGNTVATVTPAAQTSTCVHIAPCEYDNVASPVILRGYHNGTSHRFRLYSPADFSPVAGDPYLSTGPFAIGVLKKNLIVTAPSISGSDFLVRTLHADGDDYQLANRKYRPMSPRDYTDMYGVTGSDDRLWYLMNVNGTNHMGAFVFDSPIRKGITMIGPITSGAADGSFEIWSDFYNAGIADVDVDEVGIHSIATAGLYSRGVCIARDVLGATITIAPGETLRVKYEIQAAV